MSKPTRPVGRNKSTRHGKRSQARKTPASLSQPRPANSPRRRHSLEDEYEKKRKLWESKQAELEERWLAAQARLTEEQAARRRTMKLLRRVVGVAFLLLLLGAFALFGTDGGFHLPWPVKV